MSISGFNHISYLRLNPILVLIGLTPILMVILPWDFGPDMNLYRWFVRRYSLSVSIVETLVVLLAMLRGFSPFRSIGALPLLSKLGLLLAGLSALLIAAFVAVEPIGAMLSLFQIFMHLMLVLAIVHLFENRGIIRNHIWTAIGIGVVGYCIIWGIAIAAYPPVDNDWIVLVPGVTNVRWVGFFALSSYCAGISFLPAEVDKEGSRFRLFLALFFSTVGMAIGFWTGTRGAVIAIIAATIASSLFLAEARRKILLLALSATFVASLVSSVLPVVHPGYGLARIIGSSISNSNMEDLSSGRTILWFETIKKINKRPIAGWGLDQFVYVGPESSLGLRHPHQGILQLLFSTGLLGVLTTLMIALPFAKQFPRKLSLPHEWAAAAYFSGAIIYGLYDGFFYYPFPVMIFLISIACLRAATLPQPATGRSD